MDDGVMSWSQVTDDRGGRTPTRYSPVTPRSDASLLAAGELGVGSGDECESDRQDFSPWPYDDPGDVQDDCWNEANVRWTQ
eukprot:5048699-Alexandrium_andersonii.AAC.1